ncbi:MAG TPA: LpqB family beta-propeller domain-containing protein [Jatrophihabitantaceae bacterium]
MKRVLASLAVAAAVVGLSACSGVPGSSSPQAIGPAIGATSGEPPTNTPPPNAEPREIVQGFLRANATESLQPRGAREFLTSDEQRQWPDTTVTILQGSVEDAQVDVARPSGPHSVTVRVRGTWIGSLDTDGIYTPAPGGPAAWEHDYTLEKVKGQFRISDLPDGLVVYATDFGNINLYAPVRLSFLDLRGKRLVPDVRYSALAANKAALATWALNQLASGPRLELVNAVHTGLPSLPPATPPSIVLDGLTARVDIPGSSRLEDDVKLGLAAQLLDTLDSVQPQVHLSLTDGGIPVDIPGLDDPISKDDFIKLNPRPAPSAQVHFFDPLNDLPVFYLDGSGRLVTGAGKPLDGPLGTHLDFDVNSVAVSSARSDSDYSVAACVGPKLKQTLWLGQAGDPQERIDQLHRVDLKPGPLTRPSWLAGQREVWIASAAALYRVDYNGTPQQVSTGLPAGSTITAMRLSPEGSRIAMIVRDTNGQSHLDVASIVRNDSVETQGSSARLDGIQEVLPPSYRLKDVAWNDGTTLWAIGRSGVKDGIWSVNVDGSDVTDVATSGLPQPQLADSITAGHSLPAWISAGGYVFERELDPDADWADPARHTTRGRAPIYQDSYLD